MTVELTIFVLQRPAKMTGKSTRTDTIPLAPTLAAAVIGPGGGATAGELVVPAAEWQIAAKRFRVLKPLLKMEEAGRTAADVTGLHSPWANILLRFIDGWRTTDGVSGYRFSCA